MAVCVPTSWDDELILGINARDYRSNVHEFYGSLNPSVLGSGRPAQKLPRVDFQRAKEHIDLVHSSGFRFNYLINAPYLGDREFDPKFREQMFGYIEKIAKLDVDMLTLSDPYLIGLVKKEYPFFKIKAGLFANANSVNTALFFDEIGVDRITLGWNLNRDFRELEKIRRSVHAELEVIVNLGCLLDCPLRFYHRSLGVKDSPTGSIPLGILKYPKYKCTLRTVNSPEELVKSPWIRPEDMGHYEKMGVGFFKIAGRTLPTVRLLSMAGAYCTGKYDGNLFELMEVRSERLTKEDSISSVFNLPNRSLDGFLDFFVEGKCSMDCKECGYCSGIAKKHMERSNEAAASYKKELECLISNIESRSGFMGLYDSLSPGG